MTEAALYDILRQALSAAVAMAAPLLLVALVTGIAVGLLQALTAVQEMTLTFVPKIAAMLVVFWVSMTFMTNTLTGFFTRVVLPAIIER